MRTSEGVQSSEDRGARHTRGLTMHSSWFCMCVLMHSLELCVCVLMHSLGLSVCVCVCDEPP